MYCHSLSIPAKYHDNRLDILTWDQFFLSYAILPPLPFYIRIQLVHIDTANEMYT